jgi:hypothetical protein
MGLDPVLVSKSRIAPGQPARRLRRLAGKEVFFWISAAILTAIQFWLAWRM